MAFRNRTSHVFLGVDPTLVLLTLVLASTMSSVALASAPVLVRDINPTGSSSPFALRNASGALFFHADDGVHGVEPWTSDGTEIGTQFLRDVLNGPGDSYPRSFTGFGDVVHFSANDGSRGHELWTTDGTPGGTALLRDINPGAADSWPGLSTFYVDIGGTTCFQAYTNAAGYELWKTDGTAAGTALVKDIRPGTEGSTPLELVAVNDILFFRADSGTPASNREIWKSDGTEAGTVILDVNPAGSSYPGGLTQFNGMLVFSADDGTHGDELWKSDGTDGGTNLVKDIHPAGSSFPGPFFELAGTLYFVANDGTHGSELWRSDGTEQGTTMVVDLTPSGSTPITQLAVVGDRLFFVIRNGSQSAELWTSDTTPDGTVMLREFVPNDFHPVVDNLTDVNGSLFFSANDGEHGVELWTSDGTTAGTVLAADIRPGGPASFSSPDELTNVGGVLFFAANDGVNGRELWALDPAGTTGIAVDAGAAPRSGLRLRASAPNPFRGMTRLEFELVRSSPASVVHVSIVDASGRRVRNLMRGQSMDPGVHTVHWDGRDDRGTAVGSGVYFYQVEADGAREAGRVVLAR